MSRPSIQLVIPVEKTSDQLDITMDKLHQHTSNFTIHVDVDPSINVAEARSRAMKQFKDSEFICFLDYDSEMIDPNWLDILYESLINKNATAVCPTELWGSSEEDMSKYLSYLPFERDIDYEIPFGPAACMLFNMGKIPSSVEWDYNIGLRNGWLGGDFEEVDYCYKIQRAGGTIFRCVGTCFKHTGGKDNFTSYGGTDRGKTACLMAIMLDYKYRKAPDDDDFFKGLKYVRADPNNDLMLAPGESLRDCYYDVIMKTGMDKVPSIKKKGLI